MSETVLPHRASRDGGQGGLREHVYLSSVLWDGLWIVQQPISEQIARSESVLFVERDLSIFSILRRPRYWRRLFAWLRGARPVGQHLRVLAPLPLFHLGHRFPGLFALAFAVQRLWILAWTSTAGSRRRRVLWIDHPLLGCALGRMGEDLSVYHVADEPAHFPGTNARIVTALEGKVLETADIVITTADALARARSARHPRCFAVQNAIDPEAFLGTEPAADHFHAIDALPRPRAVFVGVVDRWVDVDLLRRTATSLPNMSFVLIGPTRLPLAELCALPNVHCLGPCERRAVPGVLRRCQVTLVPFVRSALTANIVPAKVWEALAAGVAPVCTAFSVNLDSLAAEGLVVVAKSDAEFVEAVRAAASEDGPGRRERLQSFGLRQTWAERWREIAAYLDKGTGPVHDVQRKSRHGTADS